MSDLLPHQGLLSPLRILAQLAITMTPMRSCQGSPPLAGSQSLPNRSKDPAHTGQTTHPKRFDSNLLQQMTPDKPAILPKPSTEVWRRGFPRRTRELL